MPRPPPDPRVATLTAPGTLARGRRVPGRDGPLAYPGWPAESRLLLVLLRERAPAALRGTAAPAGLRPHAALRLLDHGAGLDLPMERVPPGGAPALLAPVAGRPPGGAGAAVHPAVGRVGDRLLRPDAVTPGILLHAGIPGPGARGGAPVGDGDGLASQPDPGQRLLVQLLRPPDHRRRAAPDTLALSAPGERLSVQHVHRHGCLLPGHPVRNPVQRRSLHRALI